MSARKEERKQEGTWSREEGRKTSGKIVTGRV
jgi:hypothetical protein